MIPMPIRDALEAVKVTIRSSGWCVAGGFAACPTLAEDVDVWVWGVAFDGDEKLIREHLVESLRSDYGDDFEEQVGTNGMDYEGCGFIVARVGYVHRNSRDTHRVHIMLTSADSVVELVEGFDVSTHAVAITSDGEVICGTAWTPPSQAPKKLKDTPTTDARMVKIATRYGHLTAAEEAQLGEV